MPCENKKNDIDHELQGKTLPCINKHENVNS